MIKHLFTVSGLDTQGQPFVGSCVASDIIDAINMFRDKHYSPHEIKQGVQMSAEHPCCIVSLCETEELSNIAQNGVEETKRRTNKPREFPEYIGKPLRDLIKDKYPRKVGDTYIYGVLGCPHHYTLFSRDYCLCDASDGNCSDCWDQTYTGYHKIVCLQGTSSTDKLIQELVGTTPITDKDRFCLLLRECEIEFSCSDDGIELDGCVLEGDGYLFIKFYEDGKFQEFVHYPD